MHLSSETRPPLRCSSRRTLETGWWDETQRPFVGVRLLYTCFVVLAHQIDGREELKRKVGGVLHPDLGYVHRCAVEPVQWVEITVFRKKNNTWWSRVVGDLLLSLLATK